MTQFIVANLTDYPASFTPGQTPGTTTNDNATTGNVGEYKSNIILIAGEIVLTNNTTANVTSLNLTAGDWDIWGEVWFDLLTGGASLPTLFQGGVTQTSATLPQVPADGTARSADNFTATTSATAQPVLPVSPCRISLAVATSPAVFLVARAAFTSGACSAYGKLCARRAR